MRSSHLLLALFILAVCAAAVVAQPSGGRTRFEPLPPLMSNVVQSANNGEVTFQVDVADTGLLSMVRGAELIYSTDMESTWHTQDMTLIGGDYYPYTYTTSLVPSDNFIFYYHILGEVDTFFAFNTPPLFREYDLAARDFPPNNYLVQVAPEPRGDTMGGAFSIQMDITGAWFGRTEHRYYGKIAVGNSAWVGRAGPTGPFYGYTFSFENPDFPDDTVFFAMAYGQVSFLIDISLRKFTSGGLYERVADIDWGIVADTLCMSCDIDTMAQYHYNAARGYGDWGPWPNPRGFVWVGAQSNTVSFPNIQVFNDLTYKSKAYVSKNELQPLSSNRAPTLRNPIAHPWRNQCRFQVAYDDLDNNLPIIHRVVVDGVNYDLNSTDHYYYDGAIFEGTATLLTTGNHNYHFEFDDGSGIVRTAEDVFSVTSVDENGWVSADYHLAGANPSAGTIRLAGPKRDSEAPMLVNLAGAETGRFVSLGNGGWEIHANPGVYWVRIEDRILGKVIVAP